MNIIVGNNFKKNYKSFIYGLKNIVYLQFVCPDIRKYHFFARRCNK